MPRSRAGLERCKALVHRQFIGVPDSCPATIENVPLRRKNCLSHNRPDVAKKALSRFLQQRKFAFRYTIQA
jgi:hypothetical protein